MKGEITMTEVNNRYFITITAEADEIYHISNTALKKVDILNSTEGDVYVSDSNDFTATDGIASYITIPAGTAANGIYCPSIGIYVKAESEGDIAIMGVA